MAHILYAKGELVAILNSFSHYFLGELKDDLKSDVMNANIQWWTNLDDSKMNEAINKYTCLRKSYSDTGPRASILSNVPGIVRHSDGTISIKEKDIHGIEDILKQSLEAKPLKNDNMPQECTSVYDISIKEKILRFDPIHLQDDNNQRSKNQELIIKNSSKTLSYEVKDSFGLRISSITSFKSKVDISKPQSPFFVNIRRISLKYDSHTRTSIFVFLTIWRFAFFVFEGRTHSSSFLANIVRSQLAHTRTLSVWLGPNETS